MPPTKKPLLPKDSEPPDELTSPFTCGPYDLPPLPPEGDEEEHLPEYPA